MSGPKVVRVVTREELVSQGQLLLARLDQSVALWKEACESMGQANQIDLDKVIVRRNELETMFRTDQFQKLGLRANEEVAFLDADISRRRTLYFEAKAREDARRESGLKTARTLLSFLKDDAAAADEGLLKLLELATSGRFTREEVDKLLAQGFKALSPIQEKGLSQSQRDLAKRLVSGINTESFEKWTAPTTQNDPRVEAVAHGITELSLHAQHGGLVTDFEQRLDAIKAISDVSQRNLRLDSIYIEINDARERAIQLSVLVKDTKLLNAELTAFGQETDGLRRKLQLALDKATHKELEAELQAVSSSFSDIQKQRAATKRRHAVLHGLAKLGYSVNEGMATALSRAGRVLVQKPDFPDYGIELLGDADADRLQVRTVALSAVRDKTRDLDAEQRWCSDFINLKTDLGMAGTRLVVERAMAVGAVPLRVVETNVEEVTEQPSTQITPKSNVSQSS